MPSDNDILISKKKLLLKAVGKIVNIKRKELNVGINKFSFAYDIGNGLLTRLERGDTDTQVTTLWKLANAFNLKFSELALLIESELPDDFNFYD